MGPEETPKKHVYLKWPWNLVVYIVLVVVLRIFAILPILLIMWWNKKQQPNGPEEGYCLQRTRGQLIQLVWAAIFLLVGAAGAAWLVLNWLEDRTGWEYMDYIKMAVGGLVAVAGLLAAIYEAYTGLRDAFVPEKSALAQSIRSQLPYPDEAPPVRELFAMVDQDLRQNGQWFGKLGIGKEWVLGDEVSYIPRIRGVFGRNERRTSSSGDRTRVTLIIQLWIIDDRQQQQLTDLKTPKELKGAMDYLRQRVPAAVFGTYDSKEYKELIYAKEEEWYVKERAYRQRKAQFEEQEQKEQERLSQNQVLTLPDGSVTSRITGDMLRQLLLQPGRTGEASPFQLVPGIPLQGQGHTFSRLVCLPGGVQESTRILMEEYSGTPGEPGQYAWTRDVSTGEAESVLRGWLRGEIPPLEGWRHMERDSRTWRPSPEDQ